MVRGGGTRRNMGGMKGKGDGRSNQVSGIAEEGVGANEEDMGRGGGEGREEEAMVGGGGAGREEEDMVGGRGAGPDKEDMVRGDAGRGSMGVKGKGGGGRNWRSGIAEEE